MNLGNGTLYFAPLEPNSGETIELNVINAYTEELEDESLYPHIPITWKNSHEATLTINIHRLPKELILHMVGVRQIICEQCPDKRIVHLLLHGKKKRTRIKNLNRAIRFLEKEK